MNRFDALFEYSKSIFFFEHERNRIIRKQIHLLVGLYYTFLIVVYSLYNLTSSFDFIFIKKNWFIGLFFIINVIVISVYILSILGFKYKDIREPKYMLKHYFKQSRSKAYKNANLSIDDSTIHWLSVEYSVAHNKVKVVNDGLIVLKIILSYIDLIVFIYLLLIIFLKGGIFHVS